MTNSPVPFEKLSSGHYEIDIGSLKPSNSFQTTDLPTPSPLDFPSIPNKYKFNGGSSANSYNHNAIYGPNGKLLFFVYGTTIYGNNGLKLNHGEPLLKGGSEVIIFPLDNKKDCSKFGIITAGTNKKADDRYSVKLIILDIGKRNAIYKNEPLKTAINGNVVYSKYLRLEDPSGFGTVSNEVQGKDRNNIHLALTPKAYEPQTGVPNFSKNPCKSSWPTESGDSRRLYVSTSSFLFTYYLDFDGGLAGGASNFKSCFNGLPMSVLRSAGSDGSIDDRSEMELFRTEISLTLPGEEPDPPTYLLARPVRLYLEERGEDITPAEFACGPYGNTQGKTRAHWVPAIELYKIDGSTNGTPVPRSTGSNTWETYAPTNYCVHYPDLVLPPLHLVKNTSLNLFFSGMEMVERNGDTYLYVNMQANKSPSIKDLYKINIDQEVNNDPDKYFSKISPDLDAYTPPSATNGPCGGFSNSDKNWGPKSGILQGFDFLKSFGVPQYGQIEDVSIDKNGWGETQLVLAYDEGIVLRDPKSGNVEEISLNSGDTRVQGIAPAYQGGNGSNTEGVKLRYLPDIVEFEQYSRAMSKTPSCCATNSIGNDLNTYRVKKVPGNPNNNRSWYSANNPFGNYQNSDPSTIYIRDSLIIEENVDLYINDMTIKMGEGARIRVKRGARLDLNNCVITSVGCDDVRWRGIEVWGNYNEPQTVDDPYDRPQGRFDAENSQIKNAYIAVKNYREDYQESSESYKTRWYYTGAHIDCKNSEFINNWTSVSLLSYKGDDHNHIDFFKTDFIWDASLSPVDQLKKGRAPNTHVAMWDIPAGPNFTACHFVNRTPGNFDDRGVGIKAIDAAFTVDFNWKASGLNNYVMNKGSFENLRYGIDASSYNVMRSVKVDANRFINNLGGIFLKGVDLATVTRNEFEVPDPSLGGTPSDKKPLFVYGSYFWECTGYGFFQNKYEGVGASSTPWHFGSIIWNPEQGPPKSNLVYKNSYESLSYGLTVLGNNAGTDPSGNLYNPEKGLKFDCNTFYSPQSRDMTTAFGNGVSIHQGTYPQSSKELNKAISNRFINGFGGNGWEIWNATGKPGINYYHHSAPVFTPDAGGISPYVNPLDVGVSANFQDVCKDSVLRDEPGGIILDDLTGAIQRYKIQSQGLRERSDSLEGLIDGGKTQQLLKLVQGNNPPGKVKQELLKHSPYLSDTVLMSAMDQGLPPGVLKQILKANSPLVDSVHQDFEKKNVPKGIEMQVDNAQNGISPRVKLESRSAHYGARSSHLMNRVMRIYVHNDSIPGRMDSLNRILRENKEIAHRGCRRAQLKTATGEYQEARTILDTMEAKYSSLKNFCELQRLIIDLEEASKSCVRSVRKDPAKEGELRKLAQDRSRHGCLRARAILERAFEERIREVYPPLISGQNKSAKKSRNGGKKKEQDGGSEDRMPGRVSVHPNPVQNAFRVHFKGSYRDRSWNMELVDISGRSVKERSAAGSTSPTVEVSELESGIYFLRLRSENGVRNLNKKLVVKGE